MGTAQKSLRIPNEVVRAIEDLTEMSSQDFSAVAVELLTEATKMRRCPGIVFSFSGNPQCQHLRRPFLSNGNRRGTDH